IDDIEIHSTPWVSIASHTENLQLNVYPNPFSNELYVTGVNADNFNLTVIDISGRKIIQTNINDTNANIAKYLSNLEAGNYLIQIETEKQILTKRIVKE
ncbi:MAG: T9SS type A sorting domain-containing protein, partial [Bacteroidales bacterium]|nr:T9SS type A sorting domain-containing protein [Bacteroidales bacterium]